MRLRLLRLGVLIRRYLKTTLRGIHEVDHLERPLRGVLELLVVRRQRQLRLLLLLLAHLVEEAGVLLVHVRQRAAEAGVGARQSGAGVDRAAGDVGGLRSEVAQRAHRAAGETPKLGAGLAKTTHVGVELVGALPVVVRHRRLCVAALLVGKITHGAAGELLITSAPKTAAGLDELVVDAGHRLFEEVARRQFIGAIDCALGELVRILLLLWRSPRLRACGEVSCTSGVGVGTRSRAIEERRRLVHRVVA